MSDRADQLTRDLTIGFSGFAALLNARGGYYPTLRADLDGRNAELADLYDAAQAQRGDPRRAFRG